MGTTGARTRTVATQTLYRESEAQTDPYTPDVLVPEGHNPDLLTLADFKWGAHLPAGLFEIELIEKARAKRAWEVSPWRAGVYLICRRKKGVGWAGGDRMGCCLPAWLPFPGALS